MTDSILGKELLHVRLYRSMKRGVVVSTELCPDMVPLYVQLLDTYKDRPERCPTIYVVDEIMNGISYLKNADAVVGSHS